MSARGTGEGGAVVAQGAGSPPCVVRAGYVQMAPACGDCGFCVDEPQGEFCQKLLVLVQDGGRCLFWVPSAAWVRANPGVAHRYLGQETPLSPEELRYLGREHVL